MKIGLLLNTPALSPCEVVNELDFIKNTGSRHFEIVYDHPITHEKLSVVEKFLKSNKDFKDRVFFPNIEFRLDISTNTDSEEINIHLIFDNKCKIEDIKTFLSKLETANTKSNGSHYHCTPEDLSSLGYDKACISLDKLKKALKETPSFSPEDKLVESK